MTDDLLEPIADEPTEPSVEGHETPELLSTKRSNSVSVRLACAAVLTGMVAAIAITFIATRPAVGALEDDLIGVESELNDSQMRLAEQTDATDKCAKAAELAARSFAHWATYMNNVQNLHLAESPGAVDRTMDQLTASYRQVVADKVPVNSAVRNCVNGQ